MNFAAFHLVGALVQRQPSAIDGTLDAALDDGEERGEWRDMGLAVVATDDVSDRATLIRGEPIADAGDSNLKA